MNITNASICHQVIQNNFILICPKFSGQIVDEYMINPYMTYVLSLSGNFYYFD